MVRIVAQPEHIPLPLLDNGPQLVVLQQQYTVVRHALRALCNCGGLVSPMHQPKRIDDYVREFVLRGYSEPSVGDQLQP